jgi:beta-galactosidase/beta-glucuronidase
LSTDPTANYTDGYFGAVYYEREFFLPHTSNDSAFEIYFEAATANAAVYVNGIQVASHRGVGLPFAGRLSTMPGGALRPNKNRVTVRVDGLRNWQDLPPGKQGFNKYGVGILYGGDAGYYYSTPGIDANVWLSRLPTQRLITDVVTVWKTTSLEYEIRCDYTSPVEPLEACGDGVTATLVDGEEVVATSDGARGMLTVRAPKLWYPIGMEQHGSPHLYILELRTATDTYRLSVGLRTVTTAGRSVRVNGKPVYIRGTDYHQDAPVRGHGVDATLSALDIALMRRTGLNAFRMNSWPAPETTLDLADRAGILVQSEVPAIALRGGWDPACKSHVFDPAGACANSTCVPFAYSMLAPRASSGRPRQPHLRPRRQHAGEPPGGVGGADASRSQPRLRGELVALERAGDGPRGRARGAGVLQAAAGLRARSGLAAPADHRGGRVGPIVLQGAGLGPHLHP